MGHTSEKTSKGRINRDWRRKKGDTVCAYNGCDLPPSAKLGRYCDRHRHISQWEKRPRSKWVPTPEIDQLILDAWRTIKDPRRYVAEKTGWPEWAVQDHAINLGAVETRRIKEPVWSVAECETLENYSWLTIRSLQRKLKKQTGIWRSASAVKSQRYRLRLAQTVDGYNPHQLSRLLGTAPSAVRTWIRLGLLPAKNRSHGAYETTDVNYWFIPNEWVYDFVLKHPERIDLSKVDKMWFLNLLTRGKIGLAQLQSAI